MAHKKRLLLVFITLILLGAIWHHFFRLPLVPVKAVEAVPAHTSLFFSSTKGFPYLEQRVDSLIALLQMGDTAQLGLFTKLIQPNSTKIQSRNAFICLQNTGIGTLSKMLILNVKNKSLPLSSLLQSEQNSRVQSSVFKNITVYNIHLKNGATYTVAQFRNLLIVASYAWQVEEAIAHLKKTTFNLWQTNNFKRLAASNQKADFSAISNLAFLPALLKDWLPAPVVSDFAQGMQWIRLDGLQEASYVEGRILLNKEESWLKTARSQKARQMGRILHLIPENIATLKVLNLSNSTAFFRQTAARRAHEPFYKYIANWIGESVAQVTTTKDMALVFEVKDEKRALAALKELAAATGVLQSFDYQTYEIQQILEDRLFPPIWGNEADRMANPFFTFLDGYLIFGSSRAILEVWVEEFIVGRTLLRSEAFLLFFQKIESHKAQAFVYYNFRNIAPHLRSLAKRKEITDNLEQLGQMAFLLATKGSHIQLKGYRIAHAATNLPVARTIWRVSLDAPALHPPTLIDSQPYTIALQDSSFNLYLLNAAGELLWKKKLDGAILSRIYAIDYYNNATPQILFNTANHIYLIDTEGKTQGTFPLRLQSPATNGVSLVDFDNNGQYSFFVACANGNLYGFDRLGRPLSGWNPQPGVGGMRHSLLHFQQANKDYLVALNDRGALQVFARDGSQRFAIIDFNSNFLSPPDVQLYENNNRIVAVDAKGKVYVTLLDGNHFKLNLMADTLGKVHFLFADIANNGQKEYIALRDSVLKVKHYAGSKFEDLFTVNLKSNQDELCAVALPGVEKPMIGLVSRTKNQIHLLNAKGEIHPAFPIGGDTPFFVADLYANGQQILVVANGDAVCAYRLGKN